MFQIGANRSIDEVFEDTCKAIDSLFAEENKEEEEGKIEIKKPVVFILGQFSIEIYILELIRLLEF